MHFVTDGGRFSVYCTAGVLLIFKNMLNGTALPSVNICGHWIWSLFPNWIIVCCWNKNFLLFQLFCNLERSLARQTKCKYFSYDLCGRLVYVPLLFTAFDFLVSVGNGWWNSFALRRFQFIDCTDFLACLRRIPFIKDTVKRQHFHTFAGSAVHIFLNSNKGNTQWRINHLS